MFFRHRKKFRSRGEQSELDGRTHPGQYAVRWIDIAPGGWGQRATFAGGDWVPLTTPATGHWAAAVLKVP